MEWRAGGVALAVLCWIHPADAASAGSVPRLAVHRDELSDTCPDATQIASKVNELAGKTVVDSSPEAPGGTKIVVRIARSSTGYQATVEATGEATGKRELRDDAGDNCAGLSEAITVTITLIIDTLHRPVRERRPERPKPPSRPIQQEQGWGLLAAATSGLGVAMLEFPGLVAFFEVGAVSPSGHSVAATGMWVPGQRLEYQPGNVDVSLWSAGLRGCWALVGTPQGWMGSACIAPMLGSLRGSGQGYSLDGEASRRWLGLRGEGAMQVPVYGAVALSARAGLLVPAYQESFSVEGIGIAYRAARLGGFLVAGMQMTIW